MNLTFEKINRDHLPEVLAMLKVAAEKIQKKNLTQWSQWLNPKQHDVDWLLSGFDKDEFYYVYNEKNVHIGMFRYLQIDEVYWGKQTVDARYVHSLIIKNEFSGQSLGEEVLKQIEFKIKSENCTLFRLDCNASNPYLIKFYEGLNFNRVGVFEKPDGSKFNLYEKTI